MLKALLAVSCLAVAALGVTACATHPTPVSAQTAQNTPSNPDCIRDTGTRIPQPEGTCRNVPGSSYTQADIQRTGEADPAKALQKLDPRFSPGR
jgi:hypothetical protein